MSIEIGKKYRHFKGGEYEVIAIGKHSENQEDLVVYKSLHEPYDVWVRPLEMFEEEIDRDEYQGPRFREVIGNGLEEV